MLFLRLFKLHKTGPKQTAFILWAKIAHKVFAVFVYVCVSGHCAITCDARGTELLAISPTLWETSTTCGNKRTTRCENWRSSSESQTHTITSGNLLDWIMFVLLMIHERLHVNETLYYNTKSLNLQHHGERNESSLIPKQMTLSFEENERMNHESFSGWSKLGELFLKCVSGSAWRSSWRRRRVFASWWPTILTTRLSIRTRWSGKPRRWSLRGVRYEAVTNLQNY